MDLRQSELKNKARRSELDPRDPDYYEWTDEDTGEAEELAADEEDYWEGIEEERSLGLR